MQIQPGMYLVTRHNAGFGCPEFFANGGCTLHTDKAVVGFSMDEACALRDLAAQRSRRAGEADRWAVVVAEDVARLPGY